MRCRLLLAGIAFLVAACSSDSSLPTPTGKGSVRALNAIAGSPEVSYFVEESFQGRVSYKEMSTNRRWDDFEYRFNFDASFLGEVGPRRIASVGQKVDANRDYTLVLTGPFSAPSVLIWEAEERVFEESETVTEVRFAHAALSLGDVDVYFAAAGTPPALGEQRGTMSFGETLPSIDVSGGDYVLILTSAGDPTDVVYESSPVTYDQRNSFLVTVFDGDELDVAPFTVRAFNLAGGAASLPDVRVSPTVRLFQASFDLPPSDVYDDEMLTNQVLSDHVFGDFTGDISVPVGVTSYTYTAVGNVGVIQFESGIDVLAGTHNNFVVIGAEGSRVATTYVTDRRSILTIATLRIFHAALNHNELDVYVVDAGTSVDDVFLTARAVYSLRVADINLDTGSYDVYTTVAGEKTVVSGPTRLDVQLGDSVEAMIFDTVDPATAEFRIIPPP